MAVPDYQSLYLPMLRVLADGKEHSVAEIRSVLAAQLKLTDEDLRELLPSGKQPVFNNRVGWAKTYLEKAGTVRTVRRGLYVITGDGQALVKEPSSRITNKTLAQFASFRDFSGLEAGEDDPQQLALGNDSTSAATPLEQLESAYR